MKHQTVGDSWIGKIGRQKKHLKGKIALRDPEFSHFSCKKLGHACPDLGSWRRQAAMVCPTHKYVEAGSKLEVGSTQR